MHTVRKGPGEFSPGPFVYFFLSWPLSVGTAVFSSDICLVNRSSGKGGDASGFAAMDISKSGLSSAAIRLEWNTPHLRHRWINAHSPVLRTHTPTGAHNAAATGRPIPGNMVEMDAGQAKRAMIAVTAAGILANNQRAAHLTDKTAFAYSAGFFFFFILKTIHLTSYPPKVYQPLAEALQKLVRTNLLLCDNLQNICDQQKAFLLFLICFGLSYHIFFLFARKNPALAK